MLPQRLIQPADGPCTGRDSHQRQAFGNLWLRATVLLKGLRVELPGAVSRYIEVFNWASARHQVTRVEPIAIAFALRRAFSPCRSEKLAQFFTHDCFHYRLHSTTDLFPQMLMKGLLR